MIKIKLTDGTVLENDPQYGWNLDIACEIRACLQDTGHYWWVGPNGQRKHLHGDEVRRVFEE